MEGDRITDRKESKKGNLTKAELKTKLNEVSMMEDIIWKCWLMYLCNEGSVLYDKDQH